jgi:hypothetical protein
MLDMPGLLVRSLLTCSMRPRNRRENGSTVAQHVQVAAPLAVTGGRSRGRRDAEGTRGRTDTRTREGQMTMSQAMLPGMENTLPLFSGTPQRVARKDPQPAQRLAAGRLCLGAAASGQTARAGRTSARLARLQARPVCVIPPAVPRCRRRAHTSVRTAIGESTSMRTRSCLSSRLGSCMLPRAARRCALLTPTSKGGILSIVEWLRMEDSQ